MANDNVVYLCWRLASQQCAPDGPSGWRAKLLTGRSVVRTQRLPLNFPCLDLGNLAVSQPSCFLRVAWQLGIERVLQLNQMVSGVGCLGWSVPHGNGLRSARNCRRRSLLSIAQWLRRQLTDQRVRGSNPTSTYRLPLSRFGQPDSIPALVPPSVCMAARLGQPGSIPALVFPSGSMAVRQRKVFIAGRLLLLLLLFIVTCQ
ncbi:hypothetical protein CSKR_102663 [Clonorchis sinensis]|uniref:Uncharacterized protein n=1 Tax=Clonorchis sinensis TaxID=79923 RepID=A0A419PQ29_CLOSI|nr:hypothetical protein CSKR_102663 [Clonorchis sinensis]